jgi:hypothetical protein
MNWRFYADVHSLLFIGTGFSRLLFSMDKFLPFLDLFEQDSVKVEVSKAVMSAFCTLQKETTSDPVILNSMMYIGKVCNLPFMTRNFVLKSWW